MILRYGSRTLSRSCRTALDRVTRRCGRVTPPWVTARRPRTGSNDQTLEERRQQLRESWRRSRPARTASGSTPQERISIRNRAGTGDRGHPTRGEMCFDRHHAITSVTGVERWIDRGHTSALVQARLPDVEQRPMVLVMVPVAGPCVANRVVVLRATHVFAQMHHMHTAAEGEMEHRGKRCGDGDEGTHDGYFIDETAWRATIHCEAGIRRRRGRSWHMR